MPKPQEHLDGANYHSFSDYADKLSDTDVVWGQAGILSLVDHVTDEASFQVYYGDKLVVNGVHLSPETIATEPNVVIKPAAPHHVYTLVLVDPDMPSPHKPDWKDTLWWMAANIKGHHFENADFLVEYMAPEPGTGEHRYAFILYRHNNDGLKEFELPGKRISFQTKQWAKDKGLVPVSGVYFRCIHGK